MAQPHNSDHPPSLEVQILQKEVYFLQSKENKLHAERALLIAEIERLQVENDYHKEEILHMKECNRAIQELAYAYSCERNDFKERLSAIKSKAQECFEFDTRNLLALDSEPRADILSFTTRNYWLDRKALSEKWLCFIVSLDEVSKPWPKPQESEP